MDVHGLFNVTSVADRGSLHSVQVEDELLPAWMFEPMWKDQSVSVVFSTYRELHTIRRCINEFFDTGVVDEVVAVDNNAEQGTKSEILQTRAKYVLESRQGIGYGFQRGLLESSGDIIITIEVDGTYRPSDVVKLLAYSDDFEVVCGTRFDPRLIGEGAEMDFLKRSANLIYAKLIEVLFHTAKLTDVGCIFRLIKRSAYERIKDRPMDVGLAFNVDWMLHMVRTGMHFIEVPIDFLPRTGEAAGAGKNKLMAARIALQMLGIIFRHRLNLIEIPKYGS